MLLNNSLPKHKENNRRNEDVEKKNILDTNVAEKITFHKANKVINVNSKSMEDKKKSENVIVHWLRMFLKGPGRDGPILESSIKSMMYLFRDLTWMILLFFPIFLKTLWKTFSVKAEKNIRNQVVLVTGAGSGLGKEMALQFARKGCKLALVDIREDWNKRTEMSIAYAVEDEDMVKSYTCDVSKPSETKILAQKVLNDFGHVDILVNNAGILYGNSITGGSDAIIKRVVEVNFLSGFWMVRAFLPSMIKNNSGHIVFINSGSGVNPIAKSSAYCSSKFALTGLGYAMQEEFRCDPKFKNIKVTSVHPYFIKTNPDYVKNWRLRLPPLEVRDAASQIIKGIRREYQNFSVPALDLGYWWTSSIRFLPRDLYNIFLDTFYADISVDEDESESSQ